jgi:hypothetical protein
LRRLRLWDLRERILRELSDVRLHEDDSIPAGAPGGPVASAWHPANQTTRTSPGRQQFPSLKHRRRPGKTSNATEAIKADRLRLEHQRHLDIPRRDTFAPPRESRRTISLVRSPILGRARSLSMCSRSLPGLLRVRPATRRRSVEAFCRRRQRCRERR